MRNLVYGEEPKRKPTITMGDILREDYADWARKHLEGPRTHEAQRALYRAYLDGVKPQLAADHARDMSPKKFGGIMRGGDIEIWDDPIKPPPVGELSVNYNRRTKIWHFRDDRGMSFTISEEAMRELPETGFMVMDHLRYTWLKLIPSSNDKLRRFFSVEDDRGCRYPFNVMDPTPYVRSPIPIRGVFNTQGSHSDFFVKSPVQILAEWRTSNPNKQGEVIMAQTKKTEAVEVSIERTQPKLGLYFRINQLPQELSQKQTVEHVTKLLTLGADTVTVQRFIRDEVSDRSAVRY